MFKENSKISIYVNDEYLAITAVNAKAMSGQVSSAIVKDIPPGVIERGWPRQFETLKKIINKALADSKPPLSPTELVLVLPDTVVYTRVINTPHIAPEEVDKFVHKELADTIPISAQEVKLSFRSIKSKAGKRIVVSAVERKLLTRWQEFFKQLNITIDWFDVEMLALRRGLEASTASEINAVLDMGFHNSTLAVYDEVGLIFLRIAS